MYHIKSVQIYTIFLQNYHISRGKDGHIYKLATVTAYIYAVTVAVYNYILFFFSLTIHILSLSPFTDSQNKHSIPTDTVIQQKKNKRRGGETPNHQPSTTQSPPLQPISTVHNPPQNWPKINRKSNQTIRKPNSESSQIPHDLPLLLPSDLSWCCRRGSALLLPGSACFRRRFDIWERKRVQRVPNLLVWDMSEEESWGTPKGREELRERARENTVMIFLMITKLEMRIRWKKY